MGLSVKQRIPIYMKAIHNFVYIQYLTIMFCGDPPDVRTSAPPNKSPTAHISGDEK